MTGRHSWGGLPNKELFIKFNPEAEHHHLHPCYHLPALETAGTKSEKPMREQEKLWVPAYLKKKETGAKEEESAAELDHSSVLIKTLPRASSWLFGESCSQPCPGDSSHTPREKTTWTPFGRTAQPLPASRPSPRRLLFPPQCPPSGSPEQSRGVSALLCLLPSRTPAGDVSCRTQPQGPACPPPQHSPCPGNHGHWVGPPPPATRAKGRGTHRPRQPPGTPDTLALPHNRRSSCPSPGPAEPSGLLRAPHPPAVDSAPACARMGPAAGGRGSGSRRALYLSLLSRGREFSVSGAPPRPPPPPLLLSRLASSSSRCWDLRGPSQPPRPVWGPVQPRVPNPPRPIRSGPAPAPPLGGDAPSSSQARLDRGGEAGGRVGRGPLCPFL
ncbi:formin-like protein 5 [Bos indicus x Bos taurus]|uniref:formin-like protein 5 n=1 Tax=Bos indicus x Bos taurus TaxID=30522 RepID=UPI000F7D4A5F|nr:formin-like protein 5 [Bos indicus x Bos taurus]